MLGVCNCLMIVLLIFLKVDGMGLVERLSEWLFCCWEW